MKEPYKIEDFSNNDIEYLDSLIVAIEKSIRNAGIFLGVFALASFFIPMSFLPKSGRVASTKGLTIFEWFGPIGFLVFIGVMLLIFYGINIYDHKYFKLKKEIIAGKKALFIGKVSSLAKKKTNHGVWMTQIKLEQNELGIKKILLNNYRMVGVPKLGQSIFFQVTKAHHIPISGVVMEEK